MCDAHNFQTAVGMALSDNIRRTRINEIRDRHNLIGIKVYLEGMVESWRAKLDGPQVLLSQDRAMYDWALEASQPAVAALQTFEAEEDGFWIDDEAHFQKLELLASRLQEEWDALTAALAARFPADGGNTERASQAPEIEAGAADQPGEDLPEPLGGGPTGQDLPEGGWQPRWWRHESGHDLAFEGQQTVMELSAPALDEACIQFAVVCGVEGLTDVVCKGIYFESREGVIPGPGVRVSDLIEAGMPLEDLVEEALVAVAPFLHEEFAVERARETRMALERAEKAFAAQPFDLAAHDRLCSSLYHLRACFAIDPEHAHYPEGVILENFPQLSEEVLDRMLAKGERMRASAEAMIEYFNRAMEERSSSDSGS